MNYESEIMEFKSIVTDEIYKTIIAFANTSGGILYIGVYDSGNTIGIDNIDENYTHITNGVRDAIAPDVTMFVKYSLEDNNVIKIQVSEGTSKPYYLKSRGLKPSGVYIRQGASSVPASSENIRMMIKESDGDIYENMRSINQELTFDSAKSTFMQYGLEFSEEKYRVLGIKNSMDMQYTNLALIISNQCRHTTKAAVFADESNTRFKDSKEFGGSVFKQMEDTFSYLMICNKNPAEIKGLKRIEHPDYPEEAIREALLNALVHRDYSFSGSIIININDAEMEFISIGGLLQGLSAEDIRSGISQPRNKNLAEIFHRLHLIESYGTGIRRIYKLYENCTVQPKIEVTPNTFKIVLPNMNYANENKMLDDELTITDQQQKILDYVDKKGKITEEEIRSLLSVQKTRAFIIAKEMVDNGLLKKSGRGSSKKYF